MKVDIQIIGQPEVIRISDDEYFNNPKYKNLISNSRLGLLDPNRGGSIEAFLRGFGEQSYNQYFLIGSAVHDLKLQSDSYRLSDIPAPSGKMMAFANYFIDRNERVLTDDVIGEAVRSIGYRGNDVSESKINLVRGKCQEFVNHILLQSEEERKGVLYLPESGQETVRKCIKALDNNPEIDSKLNKTDEEFDEKAYNEYTVTANIRVTVDGRSIILGIKGKIDRFVTTDSEARIYDLKTTSHSAGQFHISMERYAYYIQAAFYNMLLAAVGYDVKDFTFLVVSTSDFTTGVYRMKKSDINKGREELSRLFGLAAIIAMDYNYHRSFKDLYSLRSLPIRFSARMKLLGLLCFLLQKFRKQDKGFTVKQLIQRIRKDKIGNTSDNMIERLTVWVEDMYNEQDTYPTFKMESAKDIAAYINDILDKELPFDNTDYEDDLPF